MLQKLVLLLTVAFVSGQECPVDELPAINGVCPIGILTAEGCCALPSSSAFFSTTRGPSGCMDKINPKTGISNCPQMKKYCTVSIYRQLMREQCPKTCNLCSIGGCADKLNPRTGINDCPKLIAQCKVSSYRKLMSRECPKTCGFCQ